MEQALKLGVVGFSEGNGHPYSWAALCNGYDPERMSRCGYPVIPEYLSRASLPIDCFEEKVVSVWGPEREECERLAEAVFIPHVAGSLADLLAHVDAVLLLRDDPGPRDVFLEEILKSGKPVFVDKPFALSVKEAQRMLNSSRDPWQVFSCSSLRYASELHLSAGERALFTDRIWIEAQIPKSWEKYSIHIIEPVVNNFFRNKKPRTVERRSLPFGQQEVVALFENGGVRFVTRDTFSTPICLDIWSGAHHRRLVAKDTFNFFRVGMRAFFHQVRTRTPVIPREHLLNYVALVESGCDEAVEK